MTGKELHISKAHTDQLLYTANADVSLLYLYLHSGNDPEQAPAALKMSQPRYRCAMASLRQLGLWEQPKQVMLVGERPAYSEGDVVSAVNEDRDFRGLYGEIQRRLGRNLNTEELKILLGFVRYLGMPSEVVCILVDYCKTRALQKGSHRNPSLRAIEKEAYAWAERGIDTLEEAIAFTQAQQTRFSRMGRLKELLQIRGRNLTAAEERYAKQWLEWGFEDEVILMAYERTCLNTGGLAWPYMDKILRSWQSAGLLTAQQVRTGDKKPVPKGASGQLGQAELEAIQKVLRGGGDNGIQ